MTSFVPEEPVQIRVHGPATLPALIYLPGLHGDWTLIGGFRRALRGRVQFVEITYPRTLEYSLERYAEAIEQALGAAGITRGTLLGESFGSQIVWTMVDRGKFSCDALVFAGGFVRHPVPWMVPVGAFLVRATPKSALRFITSLYARVLRLRFRKSPEVLQTLDEFFARRTPLDAQAVQHRLKLISTAELSAVARCTRIPTFMVTGLADPIVPWCLVRRWMRQNCPALREFRIIWRADHNVLGTAPDSAADQVLAWMQQQV